MASIEWEKEKQLLREIRAGMTYKEFADNYLGYWPHSACELCRGETLIDELSTRGLCPKCERVWQQMTGPKTMSARRFKF